MTAMSTETFVDTVVVVVVLVCVLVLVPATVGGGDSVEELIVVLVTPLTPVTFVAVVDAVTNDVVVPRPVVVVGADAFSTERVTVCPAT